MGTIDDDIRLIRDLVKWTDSNVNQIAKRIGVANTTLNRFAKGNATSRLHCASHSFFDGEDQWWHGCPSNGMG